MRRQSRELALQILFQAEFTPQVATSDFLELMESHVDSKSLQYAEHLADGVRTQTAAIDQQLKVGLKNWSIDRMNLIDKNICRIAIFEMQFADELIEPGVAINEAVEIAKRYSTSDSAKFINGLLDPLGKPQ